MIRMRWNNPDKMQQSGYSAMMQIRFSDLDKLPLGQKKLPLSLQGYRIYLSFADLVPQDILKNEKIVIPSL